MTINQLTLEHTRYQLNVIANEMKLLTNNIEVEPDKYLKKDRVVTMMRQTIAVLEAFDNILEVAKAE
jgi:hypothetical protein